MRKVMLVASCAVLSATLVAAGAERGEESWAQGVWPPTRLGREPSVESGKWGKKWGSDYGHKVEHCALTPEELATAMRKIVAGHPRLLLRPEPWKGGLSLAQFRARVKTEPWAAGLERMAR